MPEGRWVLRLALLALLAFVVSSTVLVRPSPVVADAVGCTGFRDTKPVNTGSCGFSPGSTCYMCERNYNSANIDIMCAESADGEISYCKPFTPSVNP